MKLPSTWGTERSWGPHTGEKEGNGDMDFAAIAHRVLSEKWHKVVSEGLQECVAYVSSDRKHSSSIAIKHMAMVTSLSSPAPSTAVKIMDKIATNALDAQARLTEEAVAAERMGLQAEKG